MNLPATAMLPAEQSLSQQLSHFGVELGSDAIPQSIRLRAKHLILDAVGIALASTGFDFARASLAGILDLGGTGEGSVIGYPQRLALRDAVLLNGILVHGLDYDDTHVPGVIHITAGAFPTVMGVGERLGSRGADVLSAYVVAVEAAARIATAARGGFHKMGFHPTGLVGTFGCALGAGRLLGLNEEQMVMAQGIALSMAAGSMEFLEDGVGTKRMHPGWAGTSGVTAAYLARNGFQGPTRAYEGRFGLFNSHLDPRDESPDLGSIVAGLGSTWELERVAVKPFPACHFLHGCADAALALVRDHDLTPDEVRSITALVPAETIPTICEPVANKTRPANDYDTKFSVQYAVAASIARGKFGLAEMVDDVRTDEGILNLARRVDYAADPDSPFPASYSGELVVETHDGRTLRHRETINRGAEERPISNGEIVRKYEENAALAIGAAQIGAIRDAILGLDEMDDICELTAVLRHE